MSLRTVCCFGLSLSWAAVACAQSTSASYTLLHSSAGDSSGGQVSGGNIVAEVSVGDPASGAVTNVSANGVQAKGNFIGQLYDEVGVDLAASPATIDEASTRQLIVSAIMDDATTLPLTATDVIFGHSGPITDINAATGIATAGIVYADTPASATASYQSFADTLPLTVLNIDLDNYQEYAGDGLDDAWQYANFGAPPNANAAPDANPDFDHFDNESEFLTGYDPTDPTDFFSFSIVARNGSTNTLELSKVIPGTVYHLQRSSDLGQLNPWMTVATIVPTVEVVDQLVEDTGASDDVWFYRIDISGDTNP